MSAAAYPAGHERQIGDPCVRLIHGSMSFFGNHWPGKHCGIGNGNPSLTTSTPYAFPRYLYGDLKVNELLIE